MSKEANVREHLTILEEFVEANNSHPDYDRAKDSITGLNSIFNDTEAHLADLVRLYFRVVPGCSGGPTIGAPR